MFANLFKWATKNQALSRAQIESWDQNGYVAITGCYSANEIDQLEALRRRTWELRPKNVVVDDLVSGRRCRIGDLSPAERNHLFFKLNDLYLEFPEIRELVLKPNVVTILRELLGDVPVLCNSLNLLRSSQQPEHIDSLYMTPRTPNKLAATWIALEDVHPDAGPLFYYPGSHRIPLYRFSNGSHHFVAQEHHLWDDYIHRSIKERGLKPVSFLPKRGDMFVWHANLVHGGGRANDQTRTRNSLVCHFWTETDCRAQGMDLEALNGAFWYSRSPQPVPNPKAA